jgi:hypothetical protein
VGEDFVGDFGYQIPNKVFRTIEVGKAQGTNCGKTQRRTIGSAGPSSLATLQKMARRTYDSFGNSEKRKDNDGTSWKQLEEEEEHNLIAMEPSTVPPPSSSSLPTLQEEHSEVIHPMFLLGFLLISFGYMLPWTALGSLISYYKNNYSARFYVSLYCGFYLPGLPVSILQYIWNEKIDRWYGSQNAFFTRGVIGFTLLAFVLFSMLWVEQRVAMMILFSLLGVGCWWLHGTASMLASLFPKMAIAYLQIGFRCPEIFSVLAVYFLDIGKDASDEHLAIFYKLTAIIVLLCFGVYVMVTNSSVAVRYFQDKDYRIRTGTSRVNLSSTDDEFLSLLGRKQGYQDISNFPPTTKREAINTNEPLSYEDDEEAMDEWTVIRSSPSRLTAAVGDRPSTSTSNLHRISDSDNVSKSIPPAAFDRKSRPSKSMGSAGDFLCQYACILPAQWLGNAIKFMFYFLYKDDPIFLAVCPLCVALMITMWSSIFQASFFAYVDSKRGWNIEQILYFTRLFSDLLGRPLTFFPRPSFIKTPDQLLQVAMIRGFLLVIFFAYTFIPSFPQSDWFIVFFVACYSLSSGYIAVLCYEYAASETLSRAQRAHAASILNMSFQIAAFVAVLMSVLITSGTWLEEQRR